MIWVFLAASFIAFLNVNAEESLEEVNGYYRFEDDMLLPKNVVRRLLDTGKLEESSGKDDKKEGVKQGLTASLYQRWPKGVVPYVIDKALICSGFGCVFKGASKLKPAMREWEQKTCIRFRPKRDSDRDYVHFKSSSWGHCAAHIGRIGGEQFVYLGRMCRSKGIILHEIGHALGFFHEQSRPDRDKYVTINWDNIDKKHRHNFKQYKAGTSDMGTPYDYDSIMHYGPKEFKIWYKFGKTIIPKQKGRKIGQREYLSEWDVKEMNKYYECEKEI